MIVGLGNPGPEHSGTRHNAGFWFVDALAAGHGTGFSPDRRSAGEAAQVTVAGHALRLFKPMQYMNRSGLPVRTLVDFYKLTPEQVLVAHDDLDLEPGTVRLKRGGGHGGHNGLRDLISHMGPDFLRLRFGIGHPRDARGGEPVEWVLRQPSPADREAIHDAIASALDEVPNLFDEQGVERVMERLNRRA